MAKALKGQQCLFESREDTGTWSPSSSFPDLSRHKEVWLDCTTTGNDKQNDRPVGIAITTLAGSAFLPFGFEGGGNLPEEQVKRWAKAELRGKRIGNLNTGFDAETMLNWGVDLEEQGCSLHDVAHAAALLNEDRYSNEFSLGKLGMEYVGRAKVDCPVKAENHHKVHSSMVAAYEMGDSELARDIDLSQRPKLEAEDLGRVMALEDALIWPNNHMERNGMRLDVPKLAQWRSELDEEYAGLMLRIWEQTFVKMRPNTQEAWGTLFDKLGIARNLTGKKKKGKSLWSEVDVESYTDDFLKRIDHPLVAAGLRMRRLASLKSKYLDKYWKARNGDRLGFKLYQMRASEEDFGTVVGRYSSASVNIQQVFKVSNQEERFGPGFIIRELMIPDDGFDLFAVDGSQLQFRLFAHYSMDKGLIEAYQRDLHLKPGEKPVDFHDTVALLFELTRQAAKHNNFAKVLGMGDEKLCVRVGHPCTCKDHEWWAEARLIPNDSPSKRAHVFSVVENHDEGCGALIGIDMSRQYDAKFPAAKKTMKLVSKTAEERGWIATLLGRRMRSKGPGDKFYSFFAKLLQGSEADVVKSKILTLYRERKNIGIHKLRAPVHDEVTGDISKDPADKKRFEECCAEQELKVSVPIIWNAGYGRNWKETK